MFEKIEREIENTCHKCKLKDSCIKENCSVYRIKQILNEEEIEVSKINIDDFFEREIKDQTSLFDFMEQP